MSFVLPSKLAAPEATWEREVDVVVLGSGASGLAAALTMRPARSVLVVTKDVLAAGSTAWAQGGLAAVLDPADSIENHVRDTLEAGAGLCDETAVRLLAGAAPPAGGPRAHPARRHVRPRRVGRDGAHDGGRALAPAHRPRRG